MPIIVEGSANGYAWYFYISKIV